MPPNFRPRISPSGPFGGAEGDLGFVSRVFHYYNSGDVAVSEGDTDETIVEAPIALAAADQPLSGLSWLAIATAQVRVPIPQGEEPLAFPWFLTLGCVTAAPSTPIVQPHIGWPTSPDDYNAYNLLAAHFVFTATAFNFQLGANTIRVGMTFQNTGGAHTAWVDTGRARLSIVEYKRPSVIIGTS